MRPRSSNRWWRQLGDHQVTKLAADASEPPLGQQADRAAGATDDRVLTDCHLNQGRLRGDFETA